MKNKTNWKSISVQAEWIYRLPDKKEHTIYINIVLNIIYKTKYAQCLLKALHNCLFAKTLFCVTFPMHQVFNNRIFSTRIVSNAQYDQLQLRSKVMDTIDERFTIAHFVSTEGCC